MTRPDVERVTGIENYRSFGGRTADAAAVTNALRHAGVVNPLTKKPFTEAAILGIAGGIGCGYSFCPSVLRYGMGSGITIVSRHLSYTFDGSFHRAALERLGIRPKTTESSTPGGGLKNLRAEIGTGRPVMVWCTRNLGYLEGDPAEAMMGCCAWSLVVHRLDEERQEAHVADLAKGSVIVPIATLSTARSAVCTHRNRTMTFDPPRSLSAAGVAKAYRDGIASCVAAQKKPRIKTFSLAGLETASRLIANFSGKQGWLKLFGKRMFWPLKDVFVTVETAGGGGLMRPMYAEFLAEAASATDNRALAECAGDYRKLGDAWRTFADDVLPSAVKPFKTVKDLRRKRVEVFHEKGVAGLVQNRKCWEELALVERDLTKCFPVKEKQTRDLLAHIQSELGLLIDGEKKALDRLAAALG